jgi:hypothetical protein
VTAVNVAEGKLILEVEGWDKLWSLRSRLEIPLEHVAGVYSDPEIARGVWHGLRIGGTSVPGVITAGTFYQHGEWIFWDVHHPENTIVFDLHDEHYKKLVIEVADPAEAVGRIQSALGQGR